ncbi:uncharacterized protein G2W53_026620 [Senna tora]|uniref:Uncharacterized protein n=1 Tax=Senna tora TaxID=362788 RepID=A0A834WF91_9FABA|nr:uncharacterized protein G2W53_026620 [Senna tora]
MDFDIAVLSITNGSCSKNWERKGPLLDNRSKWP